MLTAVLDEVLGQRQPDRVIDAHPDQLDIVLVDDDPPLTILNLAADVE